MLTLSQAKDLVAARLTIGDYGDSEASVVVMDELTIQKPYGWVFFYQSQRFLETGDPRDGLAGNSPLIVNRHTGEVVETGTARDVAYYLAQYEASFVAPGAGAD